MLTGCIDINQDEWFMLKEHGVAVILVTSCSLMHYNDKLGVTLNEALAF